MIRFTLILLTCLFVITGCASKHKAGGYYQDDGPADRIPADIDAIPDATPKIEPHRPANARPYKVLGKYYRPLLTNDNYRETGIASWYGRKFHGKQTASGETYDMHAMTAAHRTLPLPSYARVTRVKTGKSIIVRINDRGPFHSNRIIDLSYVAAAKLGLIGPGSGRVTVEAITHDDIRQEAWQRDASEPATITTADWSPSSDALTVSRVRAGVYLQYGAFSSVNNAEKFATKLNEQIHTVEGHVARVYRGSQLQRVRLGPYDDRIMATEAAMRIEALTDLTPTYVEEARDKASL